MTTCLEHLLRQTSLPDHILVMDNGSSDDSAIRAAQIQGVTVEFLGANLGFATANNRALELCKSDLVVLLNPDAFPEPDWLAALLRAAEMHPSIAAFGSRQLIYGSNSVLDGIGDCYHLSGLVWRNRHAKYQAESDLTSNEIFAPCAAAAMYRREALINVGGFDEDYFCYVEDVDLGFRLRLAGYKAMYVADAIVYHVGSATTGGQHSDFSIYHGHRNLVWTFIKNMPGVLLWLLLPLHLILNVATLVYFAYHGQWRTIFCAKADAFKGLEHMWQKRKDIQKNRRASVTDIWRALDKWPVSTKSNNIAT